MRKISLNILILFLLFSCTVNAQDKKFTVVSIGFYNLENLFDTIHSTGVNDHEFTPGGSKKWDGSKYRKKIGNMAFALSKLAREYCPEGPAVIGVSEIENKTVLKDLVNNEAVRSTGYKFVHYDSPERRGVDVALLYNPKLFTVTSSVAYPFVMPNDTSFHSRDQLLVNGLLLGEPAHFIVCHWPSRRNGEKESRPSRAAAARLSRSIIDSLQKADPNSKIILMGDLNDDPFNIPVKEVLNAKKETEDLTPGALYNPFWKILDKGIGSLGYKGAWNLFDQQILSQGWLGKDRSSLKFWKAEVFNRDFLIQQEGPYKGYPWRSFSGDTFIEGYSDHFPTLVYLVKEIK